MPKYDYLLIGPYTFGHSKQIGGATILFKMLVESCNQNRIRNVVIPTNKFQGRFYNLVNFFLVLMKAIRLIPLSGTIFLNVNRRGYIYIAPFISFYTWIWNRKFVLRIFGGDAIDIYLLSGFVQKWILYRLYKSCSLLFCETKAEVNFFKSVNPKSFWFPNSRPLGANFISRHYEKKFVYISQIKETKGILVLLNVFQELDSTYQLEIYGPIIEPRLDWIKSTNYYKGILNFDSVARVLNEQNVLILPTFHLGEGYPGIIIEAYMMSIPVITTNWKSIKDIVTIGRSGILVEPNSKESLKAAILSIDSLNYTILNHGAYELAIEFDSKRIHNQIHNIVDSVDN